MADLYTPEEINEIFRAYNDAIMRGEPITREMTEAHKDATAGVKNYTYQLNQSLKKLGASALGMAEALKEGKQGASVANDSITAFADAIDSFLSKFGLLGAALGKLLTAGARYTVEVNKQSDALFKSYNELSKFGAATSEGMAGIYSFNQQLGYGIEELDKMSALLAANSQSLAMFGGTVASGMRTFGDVAQSIQRGDVGKQLLNMGYTTEDINKNLAGYIRLQNQVGLSQKATTGQLSAGAAEYLRNLDLLTKLTGQSAETIQQEREARMSEERFAVVQRELAAKARAGDKQAEKQMEQNQKLLDLAPKELRTGLIGAMTGFAGSSKEASQILLAMPGMFNEISSGTFDANQALQKGSKEAARTLDTFGTQARVGGFGEFLGSYKGLMELENQTRAKSMQERDAEARDQAAKQTTALDKGTQAQVEMREQQRATRDSLQNMINKGINPVTKGMERLAAGIDTVTDKLVPGTSSSGTNRPVYAPSSPSGSTGAGPRSATTGTPAAVGGGGGRSATTGTPAAGGGGGGGRSGAAGPEAHQPVGGGGGSELKLAKVTSKSGKSASVATEYASQFQGLVNYLDSVGYDIQSLGGFVDRDVRGQPGVKSVHARGGAIDINPAANPYGSQLITDLPVEIGDVAARLGLGWGGNWSSVKDAMHFSVASHEGGSVRMMEDGGIIKARPGGTKVIAGEAGMDEAFVPLRNSKIPVSLNANEFKKGGKFYDALVGPDGAFAEISASKSLSGYNMAQELTRTITENQQGQSNDKAAMMQAVASEMRSAMKDALSDAMRTTTETVSPGTQNMLEMLQEMVNQQKSSNDINKKILQASR